MKARGFAAILLLSLNSITATAAPWNPFENWLNWWGPEDPNAGTTIFPTLLVPLGGTLEGMGSASVAGSLDAGFIEGNPAVSARLDTTELVFSHHGWIADSSLEGVIYTVRFDDLGPGDLGIGLGGRFLYIPFTGYNEWGESTSKGTISETVATANVAYNIFPSYGYSGFAVGANLKAAYRHVPRDISPDQSIVGLMADLGFQTSFSALKFQRWTLPNWSVGAVLRNLGVTTMADESLPLTASAGFSYAPVRAVTIAADWNLPILAAAPFDEWLVGSSLALGTHVAVAEFLSVVGGLSYSPGNPKLSLGVDWDTGPLNLSANYNLDMSSLARNPADKFSVQARIDLGDRGRGQAKANADEKYAAGLREFSRGNLEEAIRLWTEVLAIDPNYTPARDYKEIAETTLATQQAAEQAGSTSSTGTGE